MALEARLTVSPRQLALLVVAGVASREMEVSLALVPMHLCRHVAAPMLAATLVVIRRSRIVETLDSNLVHKHWFKTVAVVELSRLDQGLESRSLVRRPRL